MELISLGSTADIRPTLEGIRPAPEDQRKKPGVAFVLSLLYPGLGHLYCKKGQTGTLTAAFFTAAIGLVVFVSPASNPLFWGIGLRAAIVLYGFGFFDAFYSAREINSGISDFLIGTNPRVAAMLNLLTSGFGYFYLGERKKGLIWFFASRVFLSAAGSNAIAVVAELAAMIVAVDAFRIARKQLRASLPAEVTDAFTVQAGLTPIVPVALGAILIFNYAALVTLGLWLPKYHPIDRSLAKSETVSGKNVYRNPKYGFQITTPGDWLIDDSSERFVFKAASPTLGCQVGLMMIAQLPVQNDTGTARQLESQIRITNPSFEWLSEGPFPLGGKQAYAVNYQVSVGPVPVVQRIIFLQHKLTFYSLTETSTLGAASDCRPVMDEVANSVNLGL